MCFGASGIFSRGQGLQSLAYLKHLHKTAREAAWELRNMSRGSVSGQESREPERQAKMWSWFVSPCRLIQEVGWQPDVDGISVAFTSLLQTPQQDVALFRKCVPIMIDFRTTAFLRYCTAMRSFFILFLDLKILASITTPPTGCFVLFFQILHVIAIRNHVLRPELGAIATK